MLFRSARPVLSFNEQRRCFWDVCYVTTYILKKLFFTHISNAFLTITTTLQSKDLATTFTRTDTRTHTHTHSPIKKQRESFGFKTNKTNCWGPSCALRGNSVSYDVFRRALSLFHVHSYCFTCAKMRRVRASFATNTKSWTTGGQIK